MDDARLPNSHLQQVINELLDRSPDGQRWLGQLWDLARVTRPESLATPRDIGRLEAAETPRDRAARVGRVFDRSVAPPLAFLRWLLANPDRMQVRDPMNFGAKSDSSREWRSKLFSQDPILMDEATQEAERQLAKRAAQRGRQKWWLFEGFARVDCCLVTDRCVIVIDAKPAEAGSPSSVWYEGRTQLWRHVEAAKDVAGDKQFAVIVVVETEQEGVAALATAGDTLAASYPHLDVDQQNELSRHLLGFVTLPQLAAQFGLTVDEAGNRPDDTSTPA
ncbi:MAG TPA: hypothetical protein VNJ02_18440 [Vicinamibacterales bacterium]|nr:hypothetical protein [Vicinamibacterales bacterium]